MQAKDEYLSDRSTELSLEHIRDEVHHNLFLSILVETGLIGLMLYLAVLATWATGAWRLWKSPGASEGVRSHGLLMLATLAAYVPNALFQPMGHMNIAHMMLFFVAGVTAALQPKAGVPARPRAAKPADAWQPQLAARM